MRLGAKSFWVNSDTLPLTFVRTFPVHELGQAGSAQRPRPTQQAVIHLSTSGGLRQGQNVCGTTDAMSVLIQIKVRTAPPAPSNPAHPSVQKQSLRVPLKYITRASHRALTNNNIITTNSIIKIITIPRQQRRLCFPCVCVCVCGRDCFGVGLNRSPCQWRSPPPAWCSGLNLAQDDAGRLSPTRPALIPAPSLPAPSLALAASLPVPCSGWAGSELPMPLDSVL